MNATRAHFEQALEHWKQQRKAAIDAEVELVRTVLDALIEAASVATQEHATQAGLPHWLTKKQAAEYVQASEAALDKWRRSGALRCGFAGTDPRFTKEDLDAYLNRACQKTEAEQETLCYSVAAPQAAATRNKEQQC
jgi:excisionase family DNA binding protein